LETETEPRRRYQSETETITASSLTEPLVFFLPSSPLPIPLLTLPLPLKMIKVRFSSFFSATDSATDLYESSLLRLIVGMIILITNSN